MSEPSIALSIRQPWAWLIVNGWKDIENRDWLTRFRGPVLIHAGKAPMDEDEWDDLRAGRNLVDGNPIAPDFVPPGDNWNDLGWGGIVGAAEIVDCVTASTSRWFVGRYGFVIRNARPLPFLACRGQLGFFTPDYDAKPKAKVAKAVAQGHFL
jgi:ASCH domain